LSVWHQGVYGDFTKDKPYMLTLLVWEAAKTVCTLSHLHSNW
jgi:hypothetical protein